ncbi:MAG: class I SAM-dependent methyltransferase [Nitrosomonas sp.]|nr:MAG: class I SAM-dependent methyltransferase [Nitrosomonas sp.]
MLKHPPLLAALIQIAAFLLTGSLVINQTEIALSLFGWSIVQGCLAGICSYALRMPAWWIPIQITFAPLVILTLALDISPMLFLVAFIGLLLVYGKSFKTQVPLYLSSKQVNQALITLLPKNRQFSFVDLGSGCGGLLASLSSKRKNGLFHGIESAPIPCLISKLRSIINPGYRIRWGDFWSQDFSQYDIVYAYLSPVPMESLWEKVRNEMRPGSLLISNTFAIPGIKPDKSIKLNDFSNSTLYLWKL